MDATKLLGKKIGHLETDELVSKGPNLTFFYLFHPQGVKVEIILKYLQLTASLMHLFLFVSLFSCLFYFVDMFPMASFPSSLFLSSCSSPSPLWLLAGLVPK